MKQENFLGTEKIPTLLLKFGLPSVVSMLVNSIYNIVDQVFIGRGVGLLGIGATNVTMPFVTIGLAIAMLISVGSAANVGLNLGRKNQEMADRILATGLTMALVAGVIVLIIGEIFLQPLLRCFGATDAIMPYAISYARIYILGIPFTTVGIMLSDETRADGNPGFSMKTMLAGAVLNVICDPLFIFVFHWGVAGAALASILGQLLTMIMLLGYLPKMRTLNFKKENMGLNLNLVGIISSLGIAASITQLANLVMQIAMNNQIRTYGEYSIYGMEIPLSVFGIVFKINGLMMSLLIGIVSGSQPIFSYNYGAKHYARVKNLVKWVFGTTFVIGVVGMIAFQTFPQQIMAIFCQDDELYNEFGVMTLKTMTMLIFLIGIQFVASTYFQSTGKPMKATILSLSRQMLISIPLLYILPIYFTKTMGIEYGIKGVMWTFPVSDALAIFLAGGMLLWDIRHLNHMIQEQKQAVQ